MALRPAGRPFASILDEFVGRWDSGERPPAEDFLEGIAEDEAIELIYQEFCLAESSGLTPDPDAYIGRFPSHRERLSRLFELVRAVEVPGDVTLPQSGDEIGPYRLLRELGRGSFARVFLAEQADLEGRLVVVKVSTRPTLEPHLLARARHPHIVEVLRHGAIDGGAMTLVVMPFLGGATLAEVLAVRRRPGSAPRWLADLDRVAAPEYRAAGAGGPARELLAGLSGPRAAAWLVARLAEALDHAHARGVTHGDLKPSNVLLAADARPLLLDFNLASDWLLPGSSHVAERGGTLAYMAPERLLALGAPAAHRPPTPSQRHRADLYALGLILAEALGIVAAEDLVPSDADLAALVRRRGPGNELLRHIERRGPAGLRPVLIRCLAPDPASRYGHARELAEDLDRYRDDRPFLHAAEPSWVLRGARRLRRRRRTLIAATLVMTAVGVTAYGLRRHDVALRRELAVARLDALWSGSEPGVFRFLGPPLIGASNPAGSPGTPLRLLASYDVLGPADWRQRRDVSSLPEPSRQELEAWLMEQAWRHATAVANRADAASDELARARTALGQAAGWTFPAPLVALQRHLEERLGRDPAGIAPRAESWLDAYLEGVAAETAGDDDRAAERYGAVVKHRPEAFWAHYRAAVVNARQANYRGAAGHLERCLAQRPDHRVLAVLLAGLYVKMGDPARADELLDRAVHSGLELDQAYRTRAYARQELGQSDDSRGAFDRYARLARQEDGRWRWRDLLDARTLFGPKPDQLSAALDRLRWEANDDQDAQLFLACCLRDAGRTEEALEEFNRLLSREPRYLTARFIRAVLLGKLKQPALDAMADVLEDSRFGDLLASYVGQNGFDEAAQLGRHAADLALNQNQPDHALALARRGEALLDRLEGVLEPRRLARLRAEYHFSIARIHATCAKADPARRERAFAELEAAVATLGQEAWNWYRHDARFDRIRQPE